LNLTDLQRHVASQRHVTLGINLRDISFGMTESHLSMLKAELMSNLGCERVPDAVGPEDGYAGADAATRDSGFVRILVVPQARSPLRGFLRLSGALAVP